MDKSFDRTEFVFWLYPGAKRFDGMCSLQTISGTLPENDDKCHAFSL